MCAVDLAAGPQVAVNLVFDGPAGGTYVLAPGADGWTVLPNVDDEAPIVRSNVHDFISWGTKRADWRDSVTGDVDRDDVAAVLDAINVI